ncbi:MAG TPA: glycosyltransferase [Candidatus Limnocylindrales bacterium]|nr:glycosyltransferase [Candidatus Limnocylindrales bacterium]
MRVLVTAAPGVGHLLPLLPLARAARERGHEVLVGTGASLAEMVGRAGLRQVTIGPASLEAAFATIDGLPEQMGPRRLLMIVRQGFNGVLAEAFAAEVRELAADWRPDVVVHEDMELGSWVAAERLDIPHVIVQATAWRPRVRAAAHEIQDDLRIRHGLPSDPALAGREGSLWFMTRPPALRDPSLDLPPNLRELRPEPDDRVGAADDAMPAWLAADNGRPRVAVTLGTVNAHRIDLLRRLIDGLAELEVDVVVALGRDPATVGAVPANVRVERYVPMSQLLPRSALVAHHSGSGTMLAAAVAACPMLLLPIGADQPDNAERCVAAGMALALEPRTLTAEAVRAAALRLLGEPAFKQRAEVVAAEIRAMPDADAAIREIERISGPMES